MSQLRAASLWLCIESLGYRILAQTSIFSHITFPNWGHFKHLFIFTLILDRWTHFPVENHLFFWMTWGWSYPFTFHGVLGGKLVSFTDTIGCQLQTFQFRTPAKPVALPSWACTHGSYQRMFGLRGVCFSQFGLTHAHRYPAGGHFEGLWQPSSGSFSHKGANWPRVVVLPWSSHLQSMWNPGPTWRGCNCYLIVLTGPLTGWKHGLRFPFLYLCNRKSDVRATFSCCHLFFTHLHL